MRLGQTQIIRSEYYDRNPLAVNRFFGGPLGPHTPQIRWTYTVPVDRAMKIDSITVSARRAQVDGTVGNVDCAVTLDDINLGAANLLGVFFLLNTLDSGDSYSAGSGLFISSAAVIRGITSDGGLSGGVNYVVMMHGTEFDA